MIGPAVYSLLNMQLVADVGHDDGSVINNQAGIGFSNRRRSDERRRAGDRQLASASLAVSPTGTRNAHYITTFQPVASQAAFFAGPGFAVDWEEFLNSPASTFQVFQLDPLDSVERGRRGWRQHRTAELVPEPASIALLAVACSQSLPVGGRCGTAHSGSRSGHGGAAGSTGSTAA